MTPRKKLSADTVETLERDFENHGIGAIETLRRLDPSAYLRVLAALVPQQITLEVCDLSDDELNARIIELFAVLDLE